MEQTRKVLLLYSGGLDTSCLVKWLPERYGVEVVTLTLDLGQPRSDLEAARRKALALGAVEAYVEDVRAEFARRFLAPAIWANALYQGQYPLSTALGRPLIVERAVEWAQRVGADAVAHGCTGKGNDQVRFEVGLAALDPTLEVLAPVREWGKSRQEEIAYAQERGIPYDADSVYSVDENLWGRSIECGVLEDPWAEPPEEVFAYTAPLSRTPDTPEYVEIAFEGGLPVALDGEYLPLEALIAELNGRAGRHGVGVIDMVEDRVVGLKSRETYECPAAATLVAAHRDLEKFCCTVHQNAFKPSVEGRWAELVYQGLWFDPLREDLQAYLEHVNRRVDGVVRLRLFKGHLQVVGRRSESGLYDADLATYEAHQTFDQGAASGFIRIWGLSTRLAHQATRRETRPSGGGRRAPRSDSLLHGGSPSPARTRTSRP